MGRLAQSMLILLASSFSCQAKGNCRGPLYVEDNLGTMDKDRDGVVTVFEVCA